MIAYTVTMEFDDPQVAEDWAAWLVNEHVADMRAAGALDAELTRLDGACALEARYHFESRAAFETYEREHAPRLRAEGLARVPAAGGVRFERRLAEVVVRQRAGGL
jgi:hypothetical protein